MDVHIEKRSDFHVRALARIVSRETVTRGSLHVRGHVRNIA
jgi:hypothetical protein